MDKIGQKSEANNRNNEDFVFTAPLPSGQLLVVGDFAQTEYLGVDATTTNELEVLMQDSSIIEAARSSVSLLLVQLASKFNGRLLVFAETYKARFQSSVVFAVVQGATLYYLPIGDCRIAIRRRASLILLNGSVWLDSFGHPLPMIVNSTQEMIRGSEPPPDQALGVSAQMNFLPAQVQTFSLERDDLVLLYSDGVDKFVSPASVIGLIEEHAANDSAQVLTARILDEARIKHGDDDRTLVIMEGPHLEAEDLAIAESRNEVKEVQEKFNMFVGDMRPRVTSLESQFGMLNTLQAEVAALSKPIGDIALRVARIPTAEEIKTLKAPNLNSEKLEKIEESLNKLTKKLKAGSGQSKVSESTDSTPNVPERTTSIHQETGPVPATLESELPAIRETDFDQPFREGLIYVQHGFYELVDETYVSRLPTKSETYFSAPQTAPAGWLTAFCLYLRLQEEQPLETANAESIKAWLQGQQNRGIELIANVPLAELKNSREFHWRIREHRARGRFSLSRKGLVEEEIRLANKIFPVIGDHSRPVSVAYHDESTAWSKVLNYVKDHIYGFAALALIAVALTLGVWSVIALWVSSKPSSGPATDLSTTEPLRLEYGADGRTLFAVSRGRVRPLDYRIKLGKEIEFQDLFARLQFSSVEELIGKIQSDAATLVSRPDEPDFVPDNLRIMTVEALDVNDASPTTSEKCERFLKRVNRLGPPRNELTHLQQLNPGLRCHALKAGDRLVIYAKAP